ncbi:GNAT family N-acetyltransferase [Acidobacteriota bacterium]
MLPIKTMEYNLRIQPIKKREAKQVCDLIIQVFHEFIAPHYSNDGVLEFQKYINPDSLMQRQKKNHFILVAETEKRIVGMIEIRNKSHISLLFVDQQFQRNGISRKLLQRSLEICLKRQPDLSKFSVNSSPNAVHVYEKLGFYQTGPEQIKNAIRFTPMELELSKAAHL